MTDLTKKVKLLRLNLSEIARKAGVTRQLVSMVVNGKRQNSKVRTILRLEVEKHMSLLMEQDKKQEKKIQ